MNELEIAAWKDRITDMLSDVLAKPRPGMSDESASSVSAREAFEQLIRGTGDVAVLPSNLVLAQETVLKVIPGVSIAISEPSGEPPIVGIRDRLDDLATASLTEFYEFLYYYADTSDIPTLSVTSD